MLEDHLFEQILYSSCAELEEARMILHNIVRRRLYKCLGQTQSKKMELVSPVGEGVFTGVLVVLTWSVKCVVLLPEGDPSLLGRGVGSDQTRVWHLRRHAGSTRLCC